MTNSNLAKTKLAHRVASGHLTASEQKIIKGKQMRDLIAEAPRAVSLKAAVTKQLGEARNILPKLKASKSKVQRFIQDGDAEIQKEEAHLAAQVSELKHAEAHAPHLREATTFLSTAESKYKDPHMMTEAEHQVAEEEMQNNLKALYKAQRLAKKFAKQAARYKEEAAKPWDGKTIPMDPDIVAHVKKYTDEHNAAESAYQKSKEAFEDASFNAPEMADARENRGKHIMVEETKKGLEGSQKHSDDIDEVAGGPKELGESVSMLEMDEDKETASSMADEIASKSFSWEQRRQDIRAMKMITQRVIARKKSIRIAQESETKLNMSAEISQKRSAKKAEMRRASAKAKDQEAWEIASKAFQQTEAEKKREDKL